MATSICAGNKQKNEDTDLDDGEPQAGGEERIRKKKFTRRVSYGCSSAAQSEHVEIILQ